MVATNRLSSIAVCPNKSDGWTALSEIPLAKSHDNAPQILAKCLPQGSLCQKGDSPESASYFVRADAMNFVNLLLTPPKVSLLMPPPMSVEDSDVAIALVAARRHPELGDAQKLSAFERNMPFIVDPELAGIDWVVLDGNLTPSLVALVRHEMNDNDNALFRQSLRGESYYVAADTEKLSRMESVLKELKRDLAVIDQRDVAADINQIAIQLTYLQQTLHAVQPPWKKPFHELWPMAVVGAVGAVGIGWGFHQGGIIAARGNQLIASVAEWIRNHNRRPPSAGAGGAGGNSGLSENVSDVSADHEFSMQDERVDSGEGADYQIDASRSYDRLQHFHINGAAVATVVVMGGVVILLPEVLLMLLSASPEALMLTAGVGAKRLLW